MSRNRRIQWCFRLCRACLWVLATATSPIGTAAEPTIVTQPRSVIASQGASVSFRVTAAGDEPLSYQWWDAVAAIPSATNPVLTVSALGEATYTVVVTNVTGSVTSAPAFLEVDPDLTAALDGAGLDWLTRFESPWLAQSGVTHDGVDAARAGPFLGAGGLSWIETRVIGPGEFSFWWKGPWAAGESLALYVNDTLIADAFGMTNWALRTLSLATGAYVLRWEFRRDTPGSGAPEAFLDEVHFNAGPSFPRIRALSGNQKIAITRTARMFVEADGTPPLHYEWYHNNQRISETTNGTLTIPNVQFAHDGLYRVTISNAYGVASTTNWQLVVTAVDAWGRNTFGQTSVSIGARHVVDLAGGWDHCLALQSNGTVVGWGRNAEGQTSIPASLTNVMAISAGGYHSMALRKDGTVVAWGLNNRGQRSVPPGLQNVVAISAGAYHSAALKNDGTIAVWGWNNEGQTNIPTGLSDVIAISAGGYHTMALKGDSTLVYWGATDPVEPRVATTNIAAVIGGLYNGTVVLQTGRAQSWGSSFGMPIDPVERVLSVAGNVYHRLGLRGDGHVVAWGGNAVDGETTVPEDMGIPAALAAGWSASYAALEILAPHLSTHPSGRSVFVGSNIGLLARATGTHPLCFQWEKNGAPIAGATNAAYFLRNAQENASGDYRVVVTNALGAVTSRVAAVVVSIEPATALDTTNVTWFTSWKGQSVVAHDGADALQSGVIGDGQSSTLLGTVPGPGRLSFWWKVSSETNGDYLRFSGGIGAEEGLSGESDWQQQTVYVGTGLRTIRWTYSKDASGISGTDAAWVDEVVFTPGGTGPTITLDPQDQSATGGSGVTFRASALGTPPLGYRWLFQEAPLGLGSNILTLTNVRRSDSGSYRVVVTNEFGSASSSLAVLRVRVPQEIVMDGAQTLFFRDADGGALTTNELELFRVEASSNLTVWSEVTAVLVATNGALLFRDAAAQEGPVRFYRILEP